MVNLKIKFKKASWIMLIVFTLLFILDIISTFSIGELLEYVEYNPIYLITGSWLLVGLLNILTIYLFLKAYSAKLPFIRYMVCSIFVMFTLLRIIIIINNFAVGENIESGIVDVEAVKAVTYEQKVTSYSLTHIFYIYIPMVISCFIYWLFSLDNKVEWKQNE